MSGEFQEVDCLVGEIYVLWVDLKIKLWSSTNIYGFAVSIVTTYVTIATDPD